MADEHMRGIVNENTVPTASDVQFQKTNPLARGDKNIKPLEVYAEHAEIRKQVHDEIRKLHDTLDSKNSYSDIVVNNIIIGFLTCITPLKNLHDPGRLPVYATRPKSTIPGKRSCVWALVSCLVQAYWGYELNQIGPRLVGRYLNKLKEINGHYPELKIAGAENRGYWLEL